MKAKRHHPHHPITAYPETIDERGLMVFPDVHQMPTNGIPFTTSYMIIALNLQGWVKAECDMRTVCFCRHDIAVLPPRLVLCPSEVSDDYHAMLIVMSVAFQEEMKQRYPDIYSDIFHYVHKPDISLTDEQFTALQQLFHMIHIMSLTNSPNRWQMMGDLLDVLFLLLQDYRQQNGISQRKPSPQEELFNRFYNAITQHYRESREVRFYAKLFNMTPKHFASVIKQHTQTNALDWINGYVLVQAKMLLRHQQEMTIQQIALQLGFYDQASFSRFFKTGTGMSPTEFRNQS